MAWYRITDQVVADNHIVGMNGPVTSYPDVSIGGGDPSDYPTIWGGFGDFNVLDPTNIAGSFRSTLRNGHYILLTVSNVTTDRYDFSVGLYKSNGTYIGSLSSSHLKGYNGAVSFVTDGTNYRAILIKIGKNYYGNDTFTSVPFTLTSEEVLDFLNGAELPEEPYYFADLNPTKGGLGEFDYSSEDDDFPTLPTISASDAGFCTLYKMTASQVKDLASYLWGLGSLASFLPIFSDPMECILSLGIVPVDPTATSTYYIKVGNLTTTVQGALVDNQYIEIDCGNVVVDGKKWANGFMNYSPYTKVELYLPYIGTVPLSVDEVMDSTVYVKYHIDLLSGSCVAYVKIVKKYLYHGSWHTHTNVLYQFSGNILTNIPITSQNFTQVLQAVIGAVASGADKGMSQGMKGGQSQGISNEINQIETMKPHVQRSGNLCASCGFMGEQIPKLVFSLPQLCRTDGQGAELGFPRYQEYTLSALKGYTTCFKVHLSNIACTDAEREEINSILTSGVVLPESNPSLTLTGSNNIGVYTYTAEKIALDKETGTSLIDQMSGYFREECYVLDPVITITPTSSLTAEKILKEANYVYLKDFGRFYFIKKMKAVAKGLIRLELHVDVLMTWASDIRNETVIVDRNENAYNLFMSDGAIRTENDPYSVVLHFSSGFSSQKFLLAVAGTPSSTPT